MAKFYGPVGYVFEQVETAPSVWNNDIVERAYSGDVLEYTSRVQEGESLNDDLTVNNRISIIADPFAYSKFQSMRYIKWMGVLWKILSVKIQRPRLILTIGGVYNGPTPAVGSDSEDPPGV